MFITIVFDEEYEESLDKRLLTRNVQIDRKVWLTSIKPEKHTYPRVAGTPIHVDTFIDNELVMFSYDSCVRSIPSVVDGLKPVQRKILYTMFNKITTNVTSIKVAALTGEVMTFANYHHGDQ